MKGLSLRWTLGSARCEVRRIELVVEYGIDALSSLR